MLGNAYLSPSYSSLIALKPRQVLLQQQERTPSVLASMAKGKPGNPSQLNPEDESTLTCSVALWLETKGFSKVLKRFLSAVQIEDDSWKARALDLNEIFSKYLQIRNGVQEDLNPRNKQDGDAKCNVSDEVEGKKKKKESKKNASDIDTARTPEDTTNNEKLIESHMDVKKDQKSYEKSKSSKESNGEIVYDTTVDQSANKQKDKKRKSKLTSQPLDSEERKTVEPAEVAVNMSKKDSKKRKRMDAEENENQPGQEVVVAENSKSKKTKKSLKEGKNVPPESSLPEAEEPVLKPNEGGAAQTGKVGPQNGAAKQMDESTKVTLENNGVDTSHSKSAGKNYKNSAEAKTVNAFQRVKIEDVKFADDRLQDNSYWAKDGADIGYGAKAQEVLGQVKGRDFRHEKTKKKHGSYRGGQIDLQSHSVKFNYSDEE